MNTARPTRLAANVARFGRILHAAGVPVGAGRVLSAIEAASLVDIANREEFRTALEATLIDRVEQLPLFHQAFEAFWRDPKLMERMLQAMLPKAPGRLPPREEMTSLNNRLRQAFNPQHETKQPSDDVPIEFDAALSFSAREVLAGRDFESMTTEELAQAKHLLRTLRLPRSEIASRRTRPHAHGRVIDMRATMRRGLRTGTDVMAIRRKRRRRIPTTLVALCDISGSMARYARMLLHFLHAIGSQRSGFHAFTFGTRLTNITRALQRRDVDVALDDVGRAVADWSGGTCIGACLHEFNHRWSRRVLAQGAIVLIVSDGLDCGEADDLAHQMQFLRRSCKRLIWLNPLLRFDGFEPRASGVRAMLPYVDDFVPAHNVASLSDLGRVLTATPATYKH